MIIKICRVVMFLILTIATQIGGLVFLIAVLVNKKIKRNSSFSLILVFAFLYLLATFLLIPNLAPIFGREPVVNTQKIKPVSFLTIALNRNYVKPKLNKLLKDTENILKNSDIEMHYLDANFPFLNGFPLLPHRSHDDGGKIDLSFVYETGSGVITSKQKSVSGYGVFEGPHPQEVNQPQKCFEKGYYQYDFPKYLTLGSINEELQFSENGNRQLIAAFLKQKNLGKIFIEPHLKYRLNLNDSRIRYHGCRAVRHDDHIHIQL